MKDGIPSQELTFDFMHAEARVYRRALTIPGNLYQIEAWGKHLRSHAPIELSLGVDPTGGEDWQAVTVMWHTWQEQGEDVWVHTQIAVRASGDALTIFLKGYHPLAVQGSATLSTPSA